MTDRIRTLSKSDFKVGSDCPTKLYYKKNGYPSKAAEDEYLAFLAEGGYLIGAVAMLVEPGGIDVAAEVRKTNPAGSVETTERALALTAELLGRERVTLYEPAFQVGRRLVRVDVLVKDGSKIDLIEVKAKSQDGRDVDWKEAVWGEYLDDLAFQTIVVRKALPGRTVTPWLMMPDKSVEATVDNLTSYFRLKDLGRGGSFRDVEIEFTGDEKIAGAIRASGLLRRWDVRSLIENRLADVEASAAAFEAWVIKEPLEHPRTPLSKACFKCEYDHVQEQELRDPDGTVRRKKDLRNGFRECWGDLAKPERHIRHLYRLGSLGGSEKGTSKTDELIALGLVDQDKVVADDLRNASGKLSSYAERILIQIEHGKAGTEWFDEEALAAELASWRYPLHFIDFEASASPLPYHKGMRPYQTVVFQWSCHTISGPTAEPVHREFLNTESQMPAREFLESLREAIGVEGTPIMWSPYENTQLRNLADWLRRTAPDTPADLLEWVDELVRIRDDGKVVKEGRLVDQHNNLVPKMWFHPRMGRSTSIKVCLPAALAACDSPRIDRWLDAVNLLENGRRPEDPYKLLPGLVEGVAPGSLGDPDDEGGGEVTNGVEAMIAYQDMVYGKHMNDPDRRRSISDALRQYCRLDTLAQVIIWEHWRTRLGM